MLLLSGKTYINLIMYIYNARRKFLENKENYEKEIIILNWKYG